MTKKYLPAMPFLKQYPQIRAVQEFAKKKKIPVYIVGGFIRDSFLGRAGYDFDFALSQGAVGFARGFSRSIRGAFVLLDEEHGCARVVKKDSAGKAETFDFADFRAAGLKGDLRHRDFTINTLVCKLSDLKETTELADVVQDFEKGLADIKARRVKMVSRAVFQEDPLRLMRAFSLQSQLGFRIEPKTLAQIRKDRDLLRQVSMERVRDELFKVLATSSAAANIRQMDRLGLLEKIIPQITVMAAVKQGGYHHLDVWGHSLETLTQFEKMLPEFQGQKEIADYLAEPIGAERSRLALLKLAVILHDIGKPQTLRCEGKKLSFHGHEHVGESIVKTIAENLKLSTHERWALQAMVRHHLRPGYLSNFKNPSARAVFRYFRDTKAEAAGIALLAMADLRATKGPMSKKIDAAHHSKTCRRLLREYFERLKAEPFVRLINGDDLIRTLKLKPSPLFAVILKEVEECQADGKLKDKKAALELAKKIVEKKKP